MKTEFDTSPYEASHGKAPRGRGSWAFGTSRNPDACDADACWFSPSMTFAEAKRWALEEAAKRMPGQTSCRLYVLS